MKFWLYLDQRDYRSDLVGVLARKIPSLETRPKCGTWSVREFDGKKFIQPVMGEITWGVLKKLTFLGELRETGNPDGK